MDPEKRQRLRKNHITLKQNLQPLPILDRLFAKGVISNDDMDAIRAQSPTSEQSHVLLDHLTRTGNKGYDCFCEALQDLQPDILKKLVDTVIDRETLGEPSDVHTFFDPSEDYELKGLVDQLTIENKITPDQLERMKNFVIGENGCEEEIMETKNNPQKFLRHLMKTRLLSRYNLTFLQSLLWRVENKALCLDVAAFARQCSQRPIHFYTPKSTAENGFSFSKFHIKGNFEHFKSIRIEDICQRVSRYLGVPPAYVIPVGVEPSESLILTLMLHNDALAMLKSVDNYFWLADLGVDYILTDETKIPIEDQPGWPETSTEQQIMEQELRKKMESERHLKQCLYDEQISNEILKDQQRDQEERLHRSEETIHELNAWYTRIFAVLLFSLHFITELLKERRGVLGKEQIAVVEAQAQYETALKKAKRWSSNHTSLLELVEATSELKLIHGRDQINGLRDLSNVAMMSMQRNFAEALTARWTERQLGLMRQKTPSPEEVRQATISFNLIIGLSSLESMFQEIVSSLANKLDDEERKKVCRAFNVPENFQTPNLKHRIFDYVIFSELDKLGKATSTNEDIEPIMKSALMETGRKDLWEEFQTRNSERLRIQQEHLASQSRKQTDINDRLDKIEKMMQTMVSQNRMTNMGFQGRGYNGIHTETAGVSDDFLAFIKGSGPFSAPFQQQRA